VAVCGEDDGGGVEPTTAADVPKFCSDKKMKGMDIRLPLKVTVIEPACPEIEQVDLYHLLDSLRVHIVRGSRIPPRCIRPSSTITSRSVDMGEEDR
jgi:hypothetical protein